MSGELETAGLASVGGWLSWKRKHAEIPPGTPCANCEAELQGTYCHVCGQEAEDFHKSSWKLLVEAVESLLHLDGRLFRTMPALLKRPGQLTRDYLDGKRASQVAPFRMFLVILLVAFFTGHLASKAGKHHEPEAGGHETAHEATTVDGVQVRGDAVTVNGRQEAIAEIQADPTMTPQEKASAIALANGDFAGFGRSLGDQIAAEEAAQAARGEVNLSEPGDSERMASFKHWAEARIQAVRDDPERFALILEIWGHRIAILALPVSALMLTLLFAFNRRFFVFDHLIFSMHSLSFQLLLLTVIFLGSLLIGGWAWALILLSPVHLFVHMKGTYQRSAIGTLARMAALFFLTNITFSLLALLWLYLGFNEMAGH